MEAFERCMSKNKTLGRYDIKHNNITDDGVMFFVGILPEKANHVFEIEISERIKKETLAEFREKLAANKPKKGKKRKGKKKKKK